MATRRNKEGTYFIQEETGFVTMPATGVSGTILTINDREEKTTNDSGIIIIDKGISELEYIDFAVIDFSPPLDVICKKNDDLFGLNNNLYYNGQPLNMVPFIMENVSTVLNNTDPVNITRGHFIEDIRPDFNGVRTWGKTVIQDMEVFCDAPLTVGSWSFEVTINPIGGDTLHELNIPTTFDFQNESFLAPVQIPSGFYVQVIATPDMLPDSLKIGYRLKGYTKVSL
jgi:hypothetical protein